MAHLSKRQFLAAGLGAVAGLNGARKALAQESATGAGSVGRRTAKTTKLFKSPDGFPNAIAVTGEGLWIGEQKETGEAAAQYHLPQPKDL
ncbi:MAG TPA: hypothetical protein VMH05_24440, partial [Bryobacteraceae bacterium]|nr:hypothetical protein [Bryobacteraceae bacterium]